MPNILLTAKEAAPYIGIDVRTLENWRTRGEGPVFVKTPGKRGKILYDPDDIKAWRDSNRFQSTAEAEASDRRAKHKNK